MQLVSPSAGSNLGNSKQGDHNHLHIDICVYAKVHLHIPIGLHAEKHACLSSGRTGHGCPAAAEFRDKTLQAPWNSSASACCRQSCARGTQNRVLKGGAFKGG